MKGGTSWWARSGQAPRHRCRWSCAAAQAERAASDLRSDDGIAGVTPAERSRTGTAFLTALPTVGAASPALEATIDRLRRELPAEHSSAGRRLRAAISRKRCSRWLPLVLAVVVVLGFIVLVALVRAPLAAAAAVSLNLLSTAAAFGVARLVFQDGALDSLLGFESQGFVDAWAPIFFFALVFALSYGLHGVPAFDRPRGL